MVKMQMLTIQLQKMVHELQQHYVDMRPVIERIQRDQDELRQMVLNLQCNTIPIAPISTGPFTTTFPPGSLVLHPQVSSSPIPEGYVYVKREER